MKPFGKIINIVFYLLLIELVFAAAFMSTSFIRCHKMKDNVYAKGFLEEMQETGRMACVSRCGITEICSCAVSNPRSSQCRLYGHCYGDGDGDGDEADDEDEDGDEDDGYKYENKDEVDEVEYEDEETDSSSECWNKIRKTVLNDAANEKHIPLSPVSHPTFTGTKKFGEKCSESDECDYSNGHCLEGTCSCTIGYSYDFDKKECLTACSDYGNAFSGYEKSSTGGCNVKQSYQFLKELCKKKCRDERSFVCINCEFYKDENTPMGTCNMCNETWSSIKEEQRHAGNDLGWFLYYRHCLN